MATYTKLNNKAKSFGGQWRSTAPGATREAGGANLVIKNVPDNLQTLTVTITASPNENGDGGLYKISLRRNGVDLAQLNTSKTNTTSFSYTFQKSEISTGQEFDIRYWNNEGGWDSLDPADYYRQESEDSATLAAYTGDTKLGDGKCIVTLTDSATLDGGATNETQGPSSCPAPTPWEQLLPICGNPPSGINSSDGLQISKTGQNQITLNLKNYVNKLVTLKIIHQAGGTWSQGFGFSIPTCSDISPNTGGSPYSRSPYSNSNITGTTIFYVYNVDGGDYNYVFTHSSVPGPRPTRTNYNLVCTPSTSTVTSTDSNGDSVTTEVTVVTCVCEPYTETYGGQWPHCPTGVAVSKNGGNRVQWQYEDGGGGDYNDQYVTVEVLNVRSAVSNSGRVCLSNIKDSVWITDSGDLTANGDYIGDYKDHSTAFTTKRFRNPATRTSLLSLPSPVCFSAFRGVVGAKTPSELNLS